jgi:hypothetical protein
VGIDVTKPKLTPWFPGTVKPARVGVYERKHAEGVYAWSRWSGKYWIATAWLRAENANARRGKSGYQALPWRGLASDPGASK